jgi:hypothetical protein
MSVFTALPQDMLQWEINRFLDPLSSLNWNEVLKKDERVYKKFPKDYAIKHQIKISHKNYEDLAWRLQISLDRVEVAGRLNEMHAPKAVKLLRKYFAFFKDPKNQVVLMYIKGRKRSFADLFASWTEDDLEFYSNLSIEQADELRIEAAEAVLLIASVPFLRNVPAKNHKSAFAT